MNLTPNILKLILDMKLCLNKYKSFLKVKCKFDNKMLINMPYDEVCFQRLEEDNPEDYAKLKSKKLS